MTKLIRDHLRNCLLSLVFIAPLSSVCFAEEASTGPKNLLENGGLEDAVDPATGLPAGWEVIQKPANSYKVEVVDGGRTGKKCLQISGTGEKFTVRIKRLPMSPERRSVISGWIKGIEGDGVVSLAHLYVNEAGQTLNMTMIGGVKSNEGDWMQSATIEHPEYTRPGANAIFIISGNGKVNALFDDLAVIKLDVTPNDLLLAAGDFESQYRENLPPVLKLTTAQGGVLQIRPDDDRPANGRYCLRMQGTGEWSAATQWPVAYDSAKVYKLTGKVRVNAGKASLRIDYFKDQGRNELLGSSTTEFIDSKTWRTLTVDTRDNKLPASHIAVTTFCQGDSEAYFDELVLLEE